MSSQNVQQHIQLPQPGDRQHLLSLLSEQGYSPADLDDLNRALDEDEREGQPSESSRAFGPRVQAWLDRARTRTAVAAGQVGTSTTADLAARVIAAYFGLE